MGNIADAHGWLPPLSRTFGPGVGSSAHGDRPMEYWNDGAAAVVENVTAEFITVAEEE